MFLIYNVQISMWLHLIIQLPIINFIWFSVIWLTISQILKISTWFVEQLLFLIPTRAVSSSVSLFCLSNDQLSQTSHYLRKLTDTLSNLQAQIQQTVIVYQISGCYVIENHVHVSASGIWASIRGLDFRAIPPRRSDHYAA